MTSFMALDGVTSFLRLKDVTIICKRMRRSLSIGRSSSLQWRKVGKSWRLRMCFHRLLSVRIEIDQLQCVNWWVIIHCLEVSCTKINHSRCALVIWSSLQLTSKQWIITQQFTAGADLFLKYHPSHLNQSRTRFFLPSNNTCQRMQQFKFAFPVTCYMRLQPYGRYQVLCYK